MPEKQEWLYCMPPPPPGQNRPHQKPITHPHATPQSPEEDDKFLGGGEGDIHPPLPWIQCKNVEIKEPLLFLLTKVDLSTKKKNKTNMIKWTSLRLTPIKFGIWKWKSV